jgi:hypothetical protein
VCPGVLARELPTTLVNNLESRAVRGASRPHPDRDANRLRQARAADGRVVASRCYFLVYHNDIRTLWWQRGAHGYEERHVRGAERATASKTATGVTTRRREGHFPAPPFSPHPTRDFGPLCRFLPEAIRLPALIPGCGRYAAHRLTLSSSPPPRPRELPPTCLVRDSGPGPQLADRGKLRRSLATTPGGPRRSPARQLLVTLGLAADHRPRGGAAGPNYASSDEPHFGTNWHKKRPWGWALGRGPLADHGS